MSNKITIHEVYELFNDRFDRLEVKLDKMGERVSAMEVWKAEIMGKMMVIASGIAIALSLTTDWIKKKLFS